MKLHDIIQKNSEMFDEKFKGKQCNCVLAQHVIEEINEGKCPAWTSVYSMRPIDIKSFLLSSQLSIIQAIDEWAEQMKEKCPEGFEQCFETHKEHKEVLSDLCSFLNTKTKL